MKTKKTKKTSSPSPCFGCLNQRAIIALLVAAAFFGLTNLASAQNFLISSNWFVPTNVLSSINHICNGDVNRGLAYSSPSNQVYVCNKGITGSGTLPAIDVLDANNGNYLGSFATNGIAVGNFLLDQIVTADDGVTYGANLTTAIGTTAFKLYQWTNWQTAPVAIFSGDPSGGTLTSFRMGDNLVVQGSGSNTLILAPVTSSTTATTNLVIFSTTNGVNFTPTVLEITNIPAKFGGNSGPQIAVGFYTNNTFLFAQCTNTSPAVPLYLVQFPDNFATAVANGSLTSPVYVSAIATNTTLLTVRGQTALNYSPAGNLLAVLGAIPNAAPSTTPINLYFGNPITSASSAATAFTSVHFAGNGNNVGGVALGGAGKTNLLFTLDCNNGVHGWGLTFVPAPAAPVISTQPVGKSVYTNLGSYTLRITAGGTGPLFYYWQYNTVSNQASATTILASTNNTYTISNLTKAASGWYDCIVSNVAGSTNSAVVQLTVNEPLTSAYVTPLWSLAADGSQPYLDTSYNTRGLAYDPNTGTLLVAEHLTQNIYALNPTNGSYMYTFTTPSSGLPIGSIFNLGQIGVADDGVLYACNVSSYNPTNSTASSSAGTDFSITRFSNIGDPAVTNYSLYPAFTGDPGAYSPNFSGSSGDRWGDSMAVRGAGTNTQILLGSYETLQNGQYGTGPGTNVSILTTSDGFNFTPTTISVTNAPDGFAYLGVAWGVGNTFWAKSPGYNLREVQYDLNSGIGTVILSFDTTASAGSLSSISGIGLDVSNNILAGVNINDTPNDLELFQIPTLGFPPQSYYQAFFPTNNANINGNAATTVKYPYIFSLDANNGIIALQYSIPLLPFGIVDTYANNQQIFTWQTILGHTYQLEATNVLTGGTNDWPHIGPAINATSSGTQSYTNSSFSGAALFYRVKAQ
jgi:hypothetical protein